MSIPRSSLSLGIKPLYPRSRSFVCSFCTANAPASIPASFAPCSRSLSSLKSDTATPIVSVMAPIRPILPSRPESRPASRTDCCRAPMVLTVKEPAITRPTPSITVSHPPISCATLSTSCHTALITGATSSQFSMISIAPATSAAMATFAGERLMTLFRILTARDRLPMDTPTASSAAPNFAAD